MSDKIQNSLSLSSKELEALIMCLETVDLEEAEKEVRKKLLENKMEAMVLLGIEVPDPQNVEPVKHSVDLPALIEKVNQAENTLTLTEDEAIFLMQVMRMAEKSLENSPWSAILSQLHFKLSFNQLLAYNK